MIGILKPVRFRHLVLRLLICLVFLCVSAGGAFAATRTWDGGGDGISWSDPSNWNPNSVPREGDLAVIDNSTDYVVLNQPSEVNDFQIRAGATLVMDNTLFVRDDVQLLASGNKTANLTGTGFLKLKMSSGSDIYIRADNATDTLSVDNLEFADLDGVNNLVFLGNATATRLVVNSNFTWTNSGVFEILVANSVLEVPSMVIPAGMTLDASSANCTLRVKGDFIETGSFIEGSTCSVEFNGTAGTVTAGSNPTQFYRLKINASSTMTANTNITVTDNWTCDGTFNPGNYTVTMTAADNTATLGGAADSAFNNLTLNKAGATFTINRSFSVLGTFFMQNATAVNANANTITINGGTWDNNIGAGAFGEGTSTVVFSGSNPILPDVAETFNNITISATVSATANANYTINGNWTNNQSTFVPGTWTVTINGASALLGTAPLTLYTCDISGSGTLTLDAGDDLSVNTITVAAGRTLTMTDNCTLRVGASVVISGNFTASGNPAPLITDRGSYFTFTFNSGNNINVSRLDVANVDNEGMKFTSKPGTLALGSINFTNSDGQATGVYLNFSFDPTGTSYTFSNCTFDLSCQFNVRTLSAATWNTETVTMQGYTGGKGGGQYEDDQSIGKVTVAAPDTNGSVRWPSKLWVGGTIGNLTSWNTGTNWSPSGVPGASDKVTIPKVTYNPTLNTNTTIAALQIESGATVSTDGSGRQLTVSGSIVLNPDDGNGVAAFNYNEGGAAFLTVNGNIISSGTVSITAPTCTVGGYIDNSGSFTASISGTFSVSESVVNSSLFVPGNMTVGGDWTNTGTYTHNNKKIIFNGSSADITQGASNFYDVDVNNGKIYTALDDLTVSNNLTVAGTLKITKTITVGNTFSSTGTMEFNGTTAQTAPAWTYNNLTLSNSSAAVSLAGNTIVSNTLLINALVQLNAVTYTITLNGTFTNNGTFTCGTSKLTCNGAATSIGGSSTTEFYNLDINNTKTLVLATTIKVKNAWTNNGTFTNTGSTVIFSGTNSSVNGSATQPFYNFTVENLKSFSFGAGVTTLRIAGQFVNDGTFNYGTSIVEFNGSNSTIGECLVAPSFYDVTVSSKLTMDAGDTITVLNQFKVNNGASFFMINSCTMNVKNVVIEGAFSANGSVPTVQDTGSKLSFIVQNGGSLDISDLNLMNPDNEGLKIVNTASLTQTIGGINFTDSDGLEAGTYLQLLLNNWAQAPYNISYCTFDTYCQYNIRTTAGTPNSSVSMVGYGGVKGGETWEDDKTSGGVITPGSIVWVEKKWDAGQASTQWSQGNNWNPNNIPTGSDRVIIPDETTLANQFAPNLNTDANVASLLVEDGGNLTSNSSRTLNIAGDFTIEADTGAGAAGSVVWGAAAGTNVYLNVGGDFSNNGDFTIQNITTGAIDIQGNFYNTGTVTNNIAAANAYFTVRGDMINSGALTPVSINIFGNWANTGTVTPGAGTVYFKGVNRTIASGIGSYFNVNIPSTASYTATDDFTITNALTLAGYLKVQKAISIPASFTSTGSTLEFNGSIPQSIPAKTYNNIVINNLANTVTLQGDIVVNGNLTINPGATLSGGNYQITVNGNFINNGTFNGSSSTVVFAGANSEVQGTSMPTFNNITINNGATLTVTNTGETIKVSGNWQDSNAATAGFVSGNSTVIFTGASSTINGVVVDTFNNISLENTCTLSIGAIGQVKLRGTFTNSGTFSAGTSTVIYSGTNGGIAGTNLGFYNLQCDGKLTVNTGDVVTVTNLLTIATTGTLVMSNDGTIRTPAVTVNGTFQTTGTPTLTDTGTKFSFTVNNASAALNINGLNFANPDDNGMRIVNAASLSIDNVNFTNSDTLQTGYYLRLEMAGITSNQYVFSGCSFDRYCQYNAYIPASAAVNAVSMTAASGEKGDEQYEYESGSGYVAGGDMIWPIRQWDGGGTTQNWTEGANWSPDGVPIQGEKVKIPSPSVMGYNGATEYPILNTDATIGSLIIEDGARLDTTGNNRNLIITGGLTVEADTGEGSAGQLNFSSGGATSKLEIQRDVSNGGTISVSNAITFTISGNLSNTGSFTNAATSANFTIGGGVTNSGVFSPATVSISGSFANSGTFTAGAGTVTLKGANSSITSGGASFNNLTIISSAIYSALDSITVSGALGVEGTLKIKNGITMSGTFSSTAGTMEFSGTAVQTVPQPPGGASYHDLHIENTSAVVSLGGDVTVTGDVVIGISANFNAQAYTVNLTGNWTNDGTFTPSTSKVVFKGVPSTVGGISVTEFNNIEIFTAKTLTVGAINQLKIKGNWVNNGTFTQIFSTVYFTGVSCDISGTAVTNFYNMEIVNGTVLGISTATGTLKVQNTFTNNGSFTPGDDTLEFNGGNSSIAGANPLITYNTTVSGTLNLNSGDDLKANNAVLVTGVLNMADTCYLRVGVSCTVQGGTFGTSGSTPVVTNIGAKYSFTVNNSGKVLLNGLFFQNANDSGLNIAANANTNIDIDNVAFSDSDGLAQGTYITLGYTSIAAYTYSFQGCTFNDGCQYNVSTTNNAGVVSNAVTMSGDSGLKTGETYENDKAGGTVVNGSIIWRVIRWEGDVNQFWSSAGNWNTGVVPTSSDKVIIPSPDDRVGAANDPVLDINSTVGSLMIYDGTMFSTSGTNRTLRVNNQLFIESDQGYGSAANLNFTSSGVGSLVNAGTIQNEGTVSVAAEIFSVSGTVTNAGSFTSTSPSFAVTGDLNNTGNFTTGSMTITGSFVNSGTFTPGAGTVTLNGSIGNVTMGNALFNSVTIPTGSVYTALDTFALSSTFTLSGYLKVKTGITFGTAFTEAGGTVDFNGTSAQTIPAETYNVIAISNASAGGVTAGGAVIAVDLTINNSSTFIGGGNTITVNGKWTNNGTFTPQTSNVTFAGAASTIEGTAVTTFNNVSVTNTLTVNVSEIKVNGTFSNTGTFTASNSTVTFNSGSSQISGNAGTVFNNLKINTGATLADVTNDVRVKNIWNNAGTFTPGSTVIRFTGSTGTIEGNATTFYQLKIAGTLTMDGSDDVTVSNGMTVLSGGTFNLTGNSILRLGVTGAAVEGTFTSSGTTPTVTDTGSKYVFTVGTASGAGIVVLNGLNFQNPGDSGLNITTNAGTAFDIDNVSFTDPGDSTGVGVFIKIDKIVASSTYAFTGCSFDNGCLYNVQTANGSIAASMVVKIQGYSGAKSGGVYENDNATGQQNPGDPDNTGSIQWPAKKWNGSVNTSWSNANNWTPAGVPSTAERVIIPSPSEFTGVQAQPTLNITTTLASLEIQDGAVLTASANDIKLTVNGTLVIQANLGEGAEGQFNYSCAGATSLLLIKGAVTNGGTMSVSNAASFTMESNFTNSNTGTFTNSTGFILKGTLANSGTLTPGNMTVTGSWSNSSIISAASGTVTFNGAAGTIVSGGQSFYSLKINSGCVYTANDSISMNAGGTLTLPGTLKLKSGITFGAAFDSTGGTLEFSGTVVQTIPSAPSSYNNITVSNASATVSFGANMTLNGTLTIAANAVVNAGAYTIIIGGDFTNSGIFQKGTSTVTFNGAPSTIGGTAITEFNSVTINATKTLQIGAVGTAKVYGVWTNNNAFTTGSSTIIFTGIASSIAGSAVTEFYNLTVDTGATMSIDAGIAQANVKNIFQNDGTFTAGSSTVYFTGTTAEIKGASASTFNNAQVTGTLALNAGSDATVSSTLTVTSTGTLTMNGSAVLRLGTPSTAGTAVIQGLFQTSGSTPTVTDKGARFSFTVSGASGKVLINNVTFNNPDINGLNIANTANTGFDIDYAAFTSSAYLAGRTYVKINFTAGSYSFAGCSFDANCQYNVYTPSGAIAGGLVVNLLGASGAKAGGTYENDDNNGSQLPAPPANNSDNTGSIRWPAKQWVGTVSNLWSIDNNWNPVGKPVAGDKVVFPTGSANYPVSLDLNATVTGMQIQDGASVSSVAADKQLTVNGGLTLDADGGAAGVPTFTFSSVGLGLLTINGTLTTGSGSSMSVSSSTFTAGGDINNSGSLTIGSASSTVNGKVTNNGTLVLNAGIIVNADWSNDGAAVFTPNTNTVTLRSSNGAIDSGGDAFYNLTIPTTYAFTANDALSVSNVLTVNGTLKIKTSLTVTTTFDNTNGTIEYNGTAIQNITAFTTYNNIVISNTSATVSAGGNFTTNNITINNNVVFDGNAKTITVNNFWTNDGSFTANGSTVTFSGTPSTVAGNNITQFANIVIPNTKSLSLSGVSTIKIAAAWTNNGGTFNSGSSTVTFTTASGVINGSATTEFNNITVDGGTLVESVTTNFIDLKGVFSLINSGVFTCGDSEVRFTGLGGNISGTMSFFKITITGTGKLTLDAGDDVTVQSTLAVNASGKLDMQNNCTLRLGTAIAAGTLTINGDFSTTDTSAKPAINAVNNGNRYSMTFSTSGTVDINGLNVIDVADTGVVMANVGSDPSFALDRVAFSKTNGSATGTYLVLNDTTMAALTFSGCTFDANCSKNVEAAVGAQTPAISFTAYGGAKSGGAFETDPQNGANPPDDFGSIRWPKKTWVGDTSAVWTNPLNWEDNTTIPGNYSKVIVPAAGVINDPSITGNVEIGSLTIEAGRTVAISGNDVNFTVHGSIDITSATLTYLTGGGSPKVFQIDGNINAAGTAAISFGGTAGSLTSNINGDITTGANASITIGEINTLSNTTTVGGNVDNSGTITVRDFRTLNVTGNFTNQIGSNVQMPDTDANQANGGIVKVSGTFNNLGSVTFGDTADELKVTGNTAAWGTISTDKGTVTVDNQAVSPNIPAGTFYNLKINTNAITTQLTGNVIVKNLLTLQTGTFSLNGFALTIGDTVAPASGTLTVSGGTLSMNTGSSITLTNGSVVTVASAAAFTATGGTIQSSIPATAYYDITLNGTVNITALDVYNTNTGGKGFYITNTASITSLTAVAFYNATVGGRHLTIEQNGPVSLAVADVYFDNTYLPGGYSAAVVDTAPADGQAVCVTFEYRDAATNGSGAGSATETVTSATVNWTYTANPDIKGAVQGFPTNAFGFLGVPGWYSTYVASRNINGANTVDRIYVLANDGKLKSPVYYYDLPDASGDVVGTPWWDNEVDSSDCDGDANTVEVLHTIYFGTTKGKIVKLIDTGAALNVAAGPWVGGLDVSPATDSPATAPVITDDNNIYCGGTGDDAKAYLFGYNKATKVRVASFPVSHILIDKAIYTVPSSVVDAGTTWLFLGTDFVAGSALIERINIDGGVVNASISNTNGSFKSPTMLSSYLYVTDDGSQNANKGWVHAISPYGGFAAEVVSYPWPGAAHTLTGNRVPAGITAAPWDDSGMLFFGDSVGKFYAIPTDNTPKTDAAFDASSFVIQLEAAQISCTPLTIGDGLVYIGNDNGKLYVIDISANAAVLNPDTGTSYYYYFGQSHGITSVSYDMDADKYMIGTSQGKIFYIDPLIDPTP